MPTISCSFENGDSCGYTNDNSAFSWEVLDGRNNQTPNPPYEITTAAQGTGVLVVRANSRPTNGSIARFVSGPITGGLPKNTKLDFWYNIQGAQNGELRVVIKETGVSRVVWKRAGEQGE